MNSDLEKAIKTLSSGGFTFAAVRGEDTLTSSQRGVKPLLDLIDSGSTLSRFSVADRVVGRAAAFLYVLLGARCVHACVMSSPAKAVFEKFNIPCSCNEEVAAIRNREGTGFCPMESAVMDIDDPNEAELAVRRRLRELTNK